MDSEVAICRTYWSRAGGKEAEEEKRVGKFREATLPKLKTADLIMVIPRGGLSAAGKGLSSPGWLVIAFVNPSRPTRVACTLHRVARFRCTTLGPTEAIQRG